MSMSVYFTSLGCPKNLTDTENLMGFFAKSGYQIISDPKNADLIVINTCAFLEKSREESISVINELAAFKKSGSCKKLYIAGCLPRYIENITTGSKQEKEYKSVLLNIDGIIDSVKIYGCFAPKIKATHPWLSYVKISEGCNNNCAYCLIPKLRGGLKLRATMDIIKEIEILSKKNVKEIIFVAQDTTLHKDLTRILKKTAKIRNIRWIRIMYAHPKHISKKLISLMANERKILKYIDLPLQHCNDKILKLMNRGYCKSDIERIVNLLREKIPEIVIRTTFIVGFPGETEKDFDELKTFVKSMKFDRVGVFPFSRENGTKAYNMKGQIQEKVKNDRLKKLMRLQERISYVKNKALMGKTLDVIVEKIVDADKTFKKRMTYNFIGRSYRDAPDIDGFVYAYSFNISKIKLGDIVKVRVNGCSTHDLYGVMIDSRRKTG